MRDLTCRELVDFLDDYLERALPSEEHEAFEKHLAACPMCVSYLQTYRESIRLGRAALRASDERVPSEVPESLVRAILAARTRS